MKKKGYSFLRIFISVSLISILLYIMRNEYGGILKVLEDTRPFIFIFGIFVFVCAITVASLRLKLIIETQGVAITFGEVVSLSFIGYFFNNFFPTSIGGDVVKAYYLYKKTDEKASSFSSVLVDRVIGLFTMIFMAFIALLLAGNLMPDKMVRYSIYLITSLSVLAIIFLTNKKFAKAFSVFLIFLRPIEDKLKGIYNMLHRYQHNKALMTKLFLISIVSQLFFFLSLAVLAFSIGSRITITDILLRVPIISAMSLLPSINGLGLREGSTVVLFAPLIGRENAFAVSILWLFLLFITSVIGGLIYALSPQFRVKMKEVERGGVGVYDR